MAAWPAYRNDACRYFLDRHRERVVGIVEHLDEAHPHLHIYLVPLDGEAFGAVHPGYGASRAARKAPGNHVVKAFKAAMSAWQDAFHEGVSVKHGLERFGPKRMRMERTAWTLTAKAEKAAKALKDAAEANANAVIESAQRRAGEADAAMRVKRRDFEQREKALQAAQADLKQRETALEAAQADLKQGKTALQVKALAVRDYEEQLKEGDASKMVMELNQLRNELKAAKGSLDDEAYRRQLRQEASTSSSSPYSMKPPTPFSR